MTWHYTIKVSYKSTENFNNHPLTNLLRESECELASLFYIEKQIDIISSNDLYKVLMDLMFTHVIRRKKIY